jgi:uncharacterized protein YndB with AHSA1/START domain
MTEPVRDAVTVPAAPDRAFAAFADLNDWWPPEYTWSADTLRTIAIDPHEGGACFELGPYGFRCDWGRVLAWEPPGRLVFTWQIGPGREPVPDPEMASEVEVRVTPEGDGSRVELEHRGFERHGDGADGYAAALGSEQGWPYILGRYAARLSG